MINYPAYPTHRPRRLRRTPSMRDLVKECSLSLSDVVYPLFVRHGKDNVRSISSMPGQFQWTLDLLVTEVRHIYSLGIRSLMLFGIPDHKDPEGSSNLSEEGVIPKAIQLIKNAHPDMLVISDLCLCDYSSYGHCTIIDPSNHHMLNEPTLTYLAKAAVVHAKAGADMIAPSGMIDGMVAAVRKGLNDAGFIYTPIMSYAAKYASSLYSPFREAAECAPQFGNRTTYQMDPRNHREALKEMAIDIAEGADVLMVKPAINYLDVIYAAKQEFHLPIAAYQVSGEYSMIHAAAEKGYVSLEHIALESLISIKRAGAHIILTYFAKDLTQWLNG